MKILIVEDERRAAEYLRQGLSESGYAVEVAHNGTDGLHAAADGDHDLLILDVMLPGIDGLAVLSALRTSKQTPVLMLTARGPPTHATTLASSRQPRVRSGVPHGCCPAARHAALHIAACCACLGATGAGPTR